MASIQGNINKLKMAHQQKGELVKISTEEYYNIELKRMFTSYVVRIDTERGMKYRSKLREKIAKLEEELKGEEVENAKEIKKKIKDLKFELFHSYPAKNEFSSKIKVLLFLIDNYKELVNSGRKKVDT